MKKIFNILYLVFVPLFFIGCLSTSNQTTVELTVSVEPTEIIFDQSLHATTSIVYSVRNASTEPIVAAELNILKRTPGDSSAEILHQEQINLEPQEQTDLSYTWNQDGVRSGDTTGTTYEIYTQLLSKNNTVLQESAPVTITLNVPDTILAQ